MYSEGQEIIGWAGNRGKVLHIHNRVVWIDYGAHNQLMFLCDTYPLLPAGREVESEWRVPVSGDTYYDAGNWVYAYVGLKGETQPDPLGLGWRRPVLKPVVEKPNIVKGLEVDDDGVASLANIARKADRAVAGGAE